MLALVWQRHDNFLLRRMDHSVQDSPAFAVALASIKMESPGRFRSSIEDVFARMG